MAALKSASAKSKSTKADSKSSRSERQLSASADFGARLRAALAARDLTNAELSRASGVSPQLISEYASGQKVAGAENLFAIADALTIRPRWLLRGEGDMQEIAEAGLEGDPDLVRLARYDVFKFGEYGKGEPIEYVSAPRWLIGKMKPAPDIWLAEMPSDALPEVARAGETIICRDPSSPLQDRAVYIIMLDGRPIVRRVFVKPQGLLLSGSAAEDEITIRPDELDRAMPVGRVLAAVKLNEA